VSKTLAQTPRSARARLTLPARARAASSPEEKSGAKCEFGKCFCSYGGNQGCGCPLRQFECNIDCCF